MGFLQQRYDQAVERIDAFLREKYGGERLNGARDPTLLKYPAAWKIEIPSGGLPQMYLAVDRRFPATLPKVVVGHADEFWGTIPHVNKDGSVCTDAPHATGDQCEVGDVADHVIGRAANIIRDGIAGRKKGDFVAEIESYWSQAATPRGVLAWSLVPPLAATMQIAWVLSPQAIIFAAEKEQCQRWLRLYGASKAYRRDMQVTLAVKLTEPLYPLEFFETNGDALDCIGEADPEARRRLLEVLDDRVDPLPVLLQMDTPNGPAQLAIRLTPAAKKDRLTKGYRSGKAPPKLLARAHEPRPCTRHIVQRAYPEWIHSRGGAERQGGTPPLASRRVLVIGCGSIGAEVAHMLVNAGVGVLTLVDGDILGFDNIGRHLLGAGEVGEFKSVALQKYLQRRFPHLLCDAHPALWEDLVSANRNFLRNFDLVISATGEWSSDSNLNMAARSHAKPAVLFGWTEAHGLAGHALLVTTRGGCLACGRSNVGEVMFRVTDWPEETLRSVPACGGFYQPYGAAETGPIKSMIASLAIAHLLGTAPRSELRSWVGDTREIAHMGGRIMPEWQSVITSTPIGQMHARPWEPHPDCPQCRE